MLARFGGPIGCEVISASLLNSDSPTFGLAGHDQSFRAVHYGLRPVWQQLWLYCWQPWGQTEGGCFLKPEYAAGENDPHPNAEFSAKVAPLFAQRVVDVIDGTADETCVTGASGQDASRAAS